MEYCLISTGENLLPPTRVPFRDFDTSEIPADPVPLDALPPVIAASALLEPATFTAPDFTRYRDAAVLLIEGLRTENYPGRDTQASILDHSTGNRKEGHDVDMGIIYADYYFIEALLRYGKLAQATTSARSHRTVNDLIEVE